MNAFNHHIPPVLSIGASLLLLLAAIGCSRSEKSPLSAKSNDPVRISIAVGKDVPIRIRATGYVAPFASIAVRSRVDGELKQALFSEGDEVKRGETILVLDSSLLESALRQAEANLRRDEALFASAEAEAHRNEVLFNEGIAPAELTGLSSAAADASQAVVAADQIAVENAQLQLSFCRIAAPIDGRMGKLLADEGNLVRKNETVLAIINQTRPVYVDFQVPEEELPVVQNELAKGPLNVNATMLGNTSETATGKLVYIDHTADRETATIPMRARFPNDDEAFWPGETVNVNLALTAPANAVVVPSSAVQADPTGQYVLVIGPDLVVERRLVDIYARAAGETIIKSGVAAGEKLVSSGQGGVTPGQRIKIHLPARNYLANTH